MKAAQSFIQQTHEVNERLLSMLSNQKECDDNVLSCLEGSPVQVKMEFDETCIESGPQWHVEVKHDSEPEDLTEDNNENR